MEKFNKNICFKSDGTKETGIKIIEELEKLGGVNKQKWCGDLDSSFYYVDKDKSINVSDYIPIGYGIVNLNKENNMEKEIIGYKLNRPEFIKAAVTIEGFIHTGFGNIKDRVFTFEKHRDAINRWKNAEVLDLWFEPVYKEVKQDIVLTLSNGKQVTVTKEGKIMAEGSNFNIVNLRKLYAFMFEAFEHINRLKVSANSINIGCWKNIEAKDLKLILETQEQQTC